MLSGAPLPVERRGRRRAIAIKTAGLALGQARPAFQGKQKRIGFKPGFALLHYFVPHLQWQPLVQSLQQSQVHLQSGQPLQQLFVQQEVAVVGEVEVANAPVTSAPNIVRDNSILVIMRKFSFW